MAAAPDDDGVVGRFGGRIAPRRLPLGVAGEGVGRQAEDRIAHVAYKLPPAPGGKPRRTTFPCLSTTRTAFGARVAAPKPAYDAIIVGGGGHGLATAYYLAKEHGMTNVAVIEKGWIGSGNAGRNTTIIRSNYMLQGNIPFYEHSMKLWEGLEQDLNYNAMVSVG